jgi:acylphosphatase
VSDREGVAGAPYADSDPVRLTAWVRGRVQGVGFRWWTRATALELGLAGWALNLDDGRVEVVAEGPRATCEELLAALGAGGTPGRVELVTHRWSPARGLTGFAER